MAIHRVGKTLLIDELVPEMVFSRVSPFINLLLNDILSNRV